jgi:TonB family protein
MIPVSFALDRQGHVRSTSVAKGSGDPAFDQAALAMVDRADPVPQPPPVVADEGLNLTMPVISGLRARTEGPKPARGARKAFLHRQSIRMPT